eukprot:scaffold246822_cov19-Tisochrysis_lutea.AAC.2
MVTCALLAPLIPAVPDRQTDCVRSPAGRTMFEEAMAALEGADRSLAFTSGMAALAAVTKLVTGGEHIVAGDDIYGGTSRLLMQVGWVPRSVPWAAYLLL